MKPSLITLLSMAWLSGFSAGQPAEAPVPTPADAGQHVKGSEGIAAQQDELAADVQQLVLEQTLPKVIELLNDCDETMNDAIDLLLEHETGGETLAAQTEVIEKIYEAAKERQQQAGGSSGSAMMDMMERMMGKTPEGEGQGTGEGEGEGGDKPGQGQEGDSDSANTGSSAEMTGNTETRRVPKAAGSAGSALPEEFRKVLEAYNRGSESLTK